MKSIIVSAILAGAALVACSSSPTDEQATSEEAVRVPISCLTRSRAQTCFTAPDPLVGGDIRIPLANAGCYDFLNIEDCGCTRVQRLALCPLNSPAVTDWMETYPVYFPHFIAAGTPLGCLSDLPPAGYGYLVFNRNAYCTPTTCPGGCMHPGF